MDSLPVGGGSSSMGGWIVWRPGYWGMAQAWWRAGIPARAELAVVAGGLLAGDLAVDGLLRWHCKFLGGLAAWVVGIVPRGCGSCAAVSVF